MTQHSDKEDSLNTEMTNDNTQDLTSEEKSVDPNLTETNGLDSEPTKETKDPSTKEEVVEELSEVDQLKKELDEKEKKILKLNDKLLRTHAKIKNTERRIKKDADLRIFESKKRMLNHMIIVSNNLDRALSVEWPENTQEYREGIQLIAKNVNDLLDISGVIEIKSLGEMYDIIKHEAVGITPYNGPENRVIDVIEKGYLLDGKVLLAAKVILSIKPQKPKPTEEKPTEKDKKDTEVSEVLDVKDVSETLEEKKSDQPS
ncbi:MAG: nucleotide exchange factor GrpE [Candidatus Hodarchaeales archaeon]|jgi:molecular chaperone GrpE